MKIPSIPWACILSFTPAGVLYEYLAEFLVFPQKKRRRRGEKRGREERRREREGREKNTYKHLYKHLFITLASSLLSACCFLLFLPLADLSCVSDSRWWFFTAKRPKFCTCIFSDTPTVPSLLCKMDTIINSSFS